MNKCKKFWKSSSALKKRIYKKIYTEIFIFLTYVLLSYIFVYNNATKYIKYYLLLNPIILSLGYNDKRHREIIWFYISLVKGEGLKRYTIYEKIIFYISLKIFFVGLIWLVVGWIN